MIVDPPYHIRLQQGRPDSEHDLFKKQFIADMLDLSEVVLKPVVHG